MSELADLLERFRRGPELVAAALTGAAGSEVDFTPPSGGWSVRQIAAHLCDSEMAGAFRIRRIIAEDNPTLEGFDQNAWAEKLDYSRRKPSQSLESFRRIRAENYELLRELPEDTFERSGYHTERGSLTLLDLVKGYAEHPEKHSLQIRAVRESYKALKAAKA